MNTPTPPPNHRIADKSEYEQLKGREDVKYWSKSARDWMPRPFPTDALWLGDTYAVPLTPHEEKPRITSAVKDFQSYWDTQQRAGGHRGEAEAAWNAALAMKDTLEYQIQQHQEGWTRIEQALNCPPSPGMTLVDAAVTIIEQYREVDQALNMRVRAQQWRPVSTPPTREDAGPDGRVLVQVTGGGINTVYWSAKMVGCTHWLGLSWLPPIPEPVDEKFEQWRRKHFKDTVASDELKAIYNDARA
jgi:hypothetical protein